jgi:hypothetical protein
MRFLLSLRRRGALLVVAFLFADAAVGIGACSTSSPDVEGGGDATPEATAGDASRDAPTVTPEAGIDTGKVGNCSPIKGKCDIVLQNCPAQQECVANGDVTECRKVEATQQLPIGRGCCPNAAGNPCLPGLTCIGSTPCVDGGPATTGRCSPACCEGDDQACGKSDPEGITGACDIQIVDSTNAVRYHACTYRQRCKPFNVEPCKAGEICLVEDKVGSASCLGTFGNKGNREPCAAANDCADGFICLGSGADGGSTCHYACLLPGSTHPFDASVEQGGPGMGGCPANEVCNLHITDLPAWYAACSLNGE